MNHLHFYTGFGLQIASEIEFIELLPSDAKDPDIFIRYGTLPDNIFPEFEQTKIYTLFRENEFLLYIPGIAKYRALEGKEITVDTCKDADKESIRLFLLSITMAALLTQRKKILLHASAILLNGKLVLFVGDSGAGKSSTVAELSKRGYTLFSDDVCVLENVSGKTDGMYAYSSYPMMKLWEDTVQKLDDKQFDKTYKIRPQVSKYGQFFHEQFSKSPYPIKMIFVLNPVESQTGEYAAKKIAGLEAFEYLSKNTYRRQFLHEHSLQALHLKLLSSLVQSSEIILLTRNKHKSEIGTFTDFLETMLGNHESK